MDIENIWKHNKGSDFALNRLLLQGDFSSIHSKLPLRKLKKNLFRGMIWAWVITIIYIAVLFLIRSMLVYISVGVLICFNIWIIAESMKLYKKIPSAIDPSVSMKDELTNNYNSFNKWWKLQLKVSLFVYPIAAAGGFMIGGVTGSGKSVETFLNNYRMVSFLVITVLILMPISYYTAKWIYKHAYGKHLEKLKILIDELSA